MIGHSSDNPFSQTTLTNFRGTGETVVASYVMPFYTLSTISIRRKFDKFSVEFGVKNMFDQAPPAISSGDADRAPGAGTTPLAVSQYDLIGRSFYFDIDAQVLIGARPASDEPDAGPCAAFPAFGGWPCAAVRWARPAGRLQPARKLTVRTNWLLIMACAAALPPRRPFRGARFGPSGECAAAAPPARLPRRPHQGARRSQDVSLSPDGKHLAALTSPDGDVVGPHRLAHRCARRASRSRIALDAHALHRRAAS